MNKIEIAKSLFKAIEDRQFDKAASLLTEDFSFNGVTPQPLMAKEWLEVHRKASQGFPDFNFGLTNLSESGNIVNGSCHVHGTHTNELPTLMPGQAPIPATNKKIKNPEENVAITFKGDKISKVTIERVPNGGIPGFLKQLGVSVPAK